MNIRLKPVWIALALATGAAQAAPVHDWYIGAGAGWAWAHDLDDFSKDASNDDTAYNAFAGYNFTENLGAELGYLSGGDWDVNGHGQTPRRCRSMAGDPGSTGLPPDC